MYLRNDLKLQDGRLKRMKYGGKSILDQVIASFPSVGIWGPAPRYDLGFRMLTIERPDINNALHNVEKMGCIGCSDTDDLLRTRDGDFKYHASPERTPRLMGTADSRVQWKVL